MNSSLLLARLVSASALLLSTDCTFRFLFCARRSDCMNENMRRSVERRICAYQPAPPNRDGEQRKPDCSFTNLLFIKPQCIAAPLAPLRALTLLKSSAAGMQSTHMK